MKRFKLEAVPLTGGSVYKVVDMVAPLVSTPAVPTLLYCYNPTIIDTVELMINQISDYIEEWEQ